MNDNHPILALTLVAMKRVPMYAKSAPMARAAATWFPLPMQPARAIEPSKNFLALIIMGHEHTMDALPHGGATGCLSPDFGNESKGRQLTRVPASAGTHWYEPIDACLDCLFCVPHIDNVMPHDTAILCNGIPMPDKQQQNKVSRWIRNRVA